MPAIRAKQPRQHHKGYLGALHDLPCLRCGGRPVEAAHIRLESAAWSYRTGVRTGAGVAEKPSDAFALPLCRFCHREGPEAEHVVGVKAFYRQWGVDPHAIAWALYTAYPDQGAMASIALSTLHLGGYKI